ncbi:hypothetical protein BT96DRAFT_1097497 [Gymnopus androsaceus JB14]|uniref:Uncharacterized protein n=1 Tax=Gymnopus androsaceus JB14 TaxID=1447944 RepID=A0A6A4HRQ5_9AGAR|nr:hypothetical protein BT96DRAFT_1097497 [Gymnopus androsaceus JB14]
MGGSAFSLLLSSSSFPRLPSAVYEALKARLTPVIQSLYLHVAIPAEAPGKMDHGDLDFIVCSPRESSAYTLAPHSVNAPHDRVKAALGASHCVLADGNRTSNFAILGRTRCVECCKLQGENDIYYQVDIHVTENKDEWDRVVYFHSFGDLGMIQGLVARNVGLVLGVNGLKYQNPPHPTLTLSTDYDRISKFFGWSNERRHAGFNTRKEIFDWVAESRFFDPKYFKSSGAGIKKVKPERTMYREFVLFANEQAARPGVTTMDMEEVLRRREDVRNEALVEFGWRDEVDGHVRLYEARKRLKCVFNGTTVKDWTGLGNNWRGVKIVMDVVRKKHEDEEGILQVLMSEGEVGVKQCVMNAFEVCLQDPAFPPKYGGNKDI